MQAHTGLTAPGYVPPLPYGWSLKSDEHGRTFYHLHGGEPATEPMSEIEIPTRREQRGDHWREKGSWKHTRKSFLGSTTPLQLSDTGDEVRPTKRSRSSLLNGPGAEGAAVMSNETTELVLRDATARMNGSWDVVELDGTARFRFCGESDSKSRFNELRGEGFSWMFGPSDKTWKYHAGVLLLRGRDKNGTMLAIMSMGSLNQDFVCTFGGHEGCEMCLTAHGVVREGAFQIFICTICVAEVFRQEINPRLGVRGGEYVLEVKPFFNVALACAITLLIDTFQRQKDGSEEAHPSRDAPAISSDPPHASAKVRYPTVPLAVSVLPRMVRGVGEIVWRRTTSLVLRDGLWGKDREWDILNRDGNGWFRYRGVSDAPSGRKELWRADGHGAYSATDTVLLMRWVVLAMQADDKNHVLFSLGKRRSKYGTGRRWKAEMYFAAEGSVRDGTLKISETDRDGRPLADDDGPLATILRPEFNPGLDVNMGEYVLVVRPLYEVDIACAIALLVDSVQRM